MEKIHHQFNTERRSTISNKFKNIVLKVRLTLLHITFVKTCLSHNIIPKFANIKINNKSNTKAADYTQKIAQKIYLKQCLKDLYSKKDTLNLKLYKTHLQITNSFGTQYYNDLTDYTNKWTVNKIKKTQDRQNKKLTKLFKEQQPIKITTSHTFYPRTINNTNVTFTKNEKDLLNKGLHHNIKYPNNSNTIKSITLDTETGIQQTNTENQDEIRHTTKNTIKQIKKQHEHTTIEHKIAKQLKEKAETHNITYLKADKGNTTVIMNKEDLHKKITNFINENNIKELQSDPTTTYQNITKQTINNSIHMIQNTEKRFLKQIHPTAPNLNAQPKIHKDNIPIRPIINYIKAPAYKLTKHIDKTIRQILNIKNDSHIRNNIELINKIKDIHIPHNSTLASFDIVNLYTNIPITETLDILHNKLKLTDTPTETITEIMDSVKTVTQQNYFTYNNKFYTQAEGLPMGSPISSLLAEIFLQNMENTKILHKNNKHTQKIIYWHRYVDDIIVLYNGNIRQCNTLLNYINKLHTQLKFTAEYEQNSTLNFLDLTIKKLNHKHTFKIYRKPTTTDNIIHNTSNHPTQHKHAAITTMLHRLLQVPMSTDDYEEELNTIKYIAQANGYEHTLVDRKLGKIKNKQIRNTQNNKYITLTYINQQSEKLAQSFKKAGYKTAFRTDNKLKNKIQHNTNNNTDKYNTSGIYKLKCTDCEKFYIGQTGRTFKQRYKEHIQALKSKSESTYANHLLNTGHTHTDINTNMEILHIIPKSHKMNTIEQYEIYRHTKTENTHILNEQTHFKSNILFDYTIQQTT